MVNIIKYLSILALSLGWNLAFAQGGEANEPTPEELDAAWTAEDAAREAAMYSDEIIDPRNVDPLGDATSASDLVVQARVASQEYVYDAAGNPQTVTTFKIDTVLKGAHGGNEITVVQDGGPVKDSADNIVIVSDTEFFNVGEDELLFLAVDADNDYATQQVVIRQRFRVYEGQVFTSDGNGVNLITSPDGNGHSLAASRDRHPDRRFTEVQIGDHTLTKNFGGGEANAPDSGNGENAAAGSGAAGYASSVDIGTLSAAIAN